MVRVSPVSHTTGHPQKSSFMLFFKKIQLKLLRLVCLSAHTLPDYTEQDSGVEHGHRKKEEQAISRVPLDEIRAWGQSFNNLMSNIEGRHQLTSFLKGEFSDENILFWQACEELKKETNPEKIEEKARIIYEDFISILSPKEVSLDSRVREKVNKNMANPTSATFDDAQAQIYMLMQRDSYPRFLNSRQYRRLCGEVF